MYYILTSNKKRVCTACHLYFVPPGCTVLLAFSPTPYLGSSSSSALMT